MANGTIAFDTLQTSGQITGTAKSVDTDYVVNGSAKTVLTYEGDGDMTIFNSLNVSSVTDHATGIPKIFNTNNFSGQFEQAPTACVIIGTDVAERPRISSMATDFVFVVNEEVDTSTDRDPSELFFLNHGDLA